MSPQQPTFIARHAVETPEQVALEFRVAGIGSRGLALAVDTLFQLVAAAIVGLILLITGLSGLAQNASTSLWTVALLLALWFCLFYGYFAVFEILWSGQTPGKRLMGIRVIKESGRPLDVFESLGRNLMRIVDQMPGFYAVGMIAALSNSRSRRLGDFVAGSLVVYERSVESLERPWAADASTPVTTALLGPNRLSPEEAELIGSFLLRSAAIEPHVRYRMAREILNRLEPKVTLTPTLREIAESTLAVIYQEHRSRS